MRSLCFALPFLHSWHMMTILCPIPMVLFLLSLWCVFFPDCRSPWMLPRWSAGL